MFNMSSMLRSFWLCILTLLGRRRRSQSIHPTVTTTPASSSQVSEQLATSTPVSVAPVSQMNIPELLPVDANSDDIPLLLLVPQAKAKKLAKKQRTGASKHSKHLDAVVNDWSSLGGQSMSKIFLSTVEMMSGPSPSHTEAPQDIHIPCIQRPMEITVSPENGPSITLYRDPHCRPSDLESGITSTFKPSAFSIRALSATTGFLADPSFSTGRSTLLPLSIPAMPSVRRPTADDDAKDRCSPYTDFFDFEMYTRPISADRLISVEDCYPIEGAEQIRGSESAKGPLAPVTNRKSIKLGIAESKVACEEASLLS